jgi:glycosyltransferase involved in cell wall biosynthesis
MARTKLLLCNHQSPSNFVGGAEFILLDIARSLDRDKFDLLMLANAEGAFTKMARGSGVSVHIIPHDIFWEFLAPGKDITNRFDRFKTAQRGSIEAIAQIIREKGIGALLANCLVNTVPLMAADECRIPTLWMIHEIVHAFDSMRQGLRKMPLFRLKSSRSRLESTKFLQNTLLRYGRMLIFITEISRSKIFASVEWRDRAIVMHPPIRRDIFFAPEPIKKSYPGIPDESFAVVFLGILFPHKGVHDFIQAASEVAKEAANVHFIVAGGTTDQTYLSKLKKMAQTP